MINKLKTWVEATDIENSEFEYSFYTNEVTAKEPEKGLQTDLCFDTHLIGKAQTVAFEIIN